jgi:hypothetical protein
VRIERSTPRRRVVVLEGILDEGGARRLLSLMTGELEQPSVAEVLFDLRGVEDYQPAARQPLVEVQRELAGRGCRSVWLAERARLRGLALWVMHAASDGAARAVMTPEQAEAWLGASEVRLDDARRRTEEALRAAVQSLAASHRRLERLK